jgi:signal recognition particle receptor subunit beta
MVLFNYSTRELTAKIVYYGPGLCGKTTNLQFIYDSLPDNVKKGKMLSLATKTDRTLFFDFLPLELGTIRGMKTRVQLYTVPGQVFYNSTRKLVLKGADGVVFVADSQAKMLEASAESYKNLEDNLREMGIRIDEIPLVMQFNKRDLPNLSSVEEMNSEINRHNAPFYEAVATTGIGVEDTLKAITKLVLNNLAAKYRLEAAPAAAAPEPASSPGPRPAPARPAAAARGRAPAPAPPAALAGDELALEELGADPGPPATAPAPPTRSAARPVATPPRAAGPARAREDVIDLQEEIDVPGLEEPRDGMIDLGEDLLQELEEESPLAERPGPAADRRGAAAPLRAVAAAVRVETPPADDPIDLDEPLELDEPWDAAGGGRPGPAPAEAIDLGTLAPGQDRAIDLPVTATINGRPVRLNLKVTVRLSR